MRARAAVRSRDDRRRLAANADPAHRCDGRYGRCCAAACRTPSWSARSRPPRRICGSCSTPTGHSASRAAQRAIPVQGLGLVRRLCLAPRRRMGRRPAERGRDRDPRRARGAELYQAAPFRRAARARRAARRARADRGRPADGDRRARSSGSPARCRGERSRPIAGDWYPAEVVQLRARDGAIASVEADRHPDPLAEAVRASIAEAELAAGDRPRPRGLNRTAADPGRGRAADQRAGAGAADRRAAAMGRADHR